MTSAAVQRAVELQPAIIERLQRIIEQNELAHAYLITGPSGSGKTTLARWLAMRLFCSHVHNGQPDGTCPECQRILSGNHPDVLVAAPTGRQIKVDTLRQMKAEFTKSGLEGNQKVFIIKDADKMTVSAANSLLKFIEEPGEGIYIFMLTTNRNAILPTIQSRTQLLELRPLAPAKLQQSLEESGVPKELRPVVTGLTDSTAQVKEWLTNDWLTNAYQAVVDWYQQVAAGKMLAYVLVETEMMKLADSREHQSLLLDLMMLVWRDTLMVANGTDQLHFRSQEQRIKQVVAHYPATKILAASQLTLGTHQLMAANVSFQNVAEQLTIRIIDAMH
ncbi:DNA polymerase III subunit delta' [uncultured Limosilactobacillus sp.]|uniref:DNA polymerase III subunit delta' n=1 Tax=uncultured Limosilactobacillus sp. TaxID=2837629 RepID=UPI0025FC6F69|nr:DNA polymerase III subunit delta' [uncultured Limosilactobacillus sp.]